MQKYPKQTYPNHKKEFRKDKYGKENTPEEPLEEPPETDSRDITKYSLLFEQLENFGDTTFGQRESALETTFTMDMSRYPFYKM